jgi:hypothetical protein
MAPSRAVRQLIMALKFQGFMDESYSADEFVLAGYIATAETWAKFAGEWEKCLPYGTRAKNGTLQFHMKEMAQTPERMKRVQLFYKIIEDNGLIPVSSRMRMSDYNQARERVKDACRYMGWPLDNFGPWDKPYFFVFRAFMDGFHRRGEIENIIPSNEKVDFIFDEKTDVDFIRNAWPFFLENQPDEVRQCYGEHPRFSSDHKFLGLQAADFWAWWVRHWYEEDAPDYPDLPDKMKAFDFGTWRGLPRSFLAFFATEDFIFDTIYEACLNELTRHRMEGR